MKRSFLLTIVMASCQAAFGQSVPNLINYQGRLTDPSGAALPMGNYGIEFRLWDSVTNNSGLVWGQRQNVGVQANGVFNVILGAPGGSPITNPIPAVNDLSFAFTSSNRFLGLAVVSSNGLAISSPSEIFPRQQLLSVPFALTAGQLVGPRPFGTNVGSGGVAMSKPVSIFSTSSTNVVEVTNLQVTLVTQGRPVMVLMCASDPSDTSRITFRKSSGIQAVGYLEMLRGTNIIARHETVLRAAIGVGDVLALALPASSFSFVDVAPLGTNSYSIKVRCYIGGDETITFENVRLVAYEL